VGEQANIAGASCGGTAGSEQESPTDFFGPAIATDHTHNPRLQPVGRVRRRMVIIAKLEVRP
jgi:hypothetical protein